MNIKKTKDYSMFVFLDGNRAGINRSQVEKLKKAIQKKNLLHINPILVNAKMEVINGQHRLIAARELDVEVFYLEDDSLQREDLICMNSSLSWNVSDHLNYYVVKGNQEYIRLKNFIEKHNIKISCALKIISGGYTKTWQDFYEGKFIFKEKYPDEAIHIYNQSKKIIRESTANKGSLDTAKFMSALLKIITAVEFNEKQWFKNLDKIGNRIRVKNTVAENVDMLVYVHNFGCKNKIKLNINDPLQE